MTNKRTFTAKIQNAGGGGAYVEVPFDVEEAFGSKRPKVKAMIEGVPYRGTLMRMGSECHILGILKDIREQIVVSVSADSGLIRYGCDYVSNRNYLQIPRVGCAIRIPRLNRKNI